MRKPAAIGTLYDRQVSLGLCAGLSTRQMARILGRSKSSINAKVHSLLHKTGMADRLEFAVQMNACTREKVWGVAA
jgi:DNA-binding NarL/FixJ family response regulator